MNAPVPEPPSDAVRPADAPGDPPAPEEPGAKSGALTGTPRSGAAAPAEPARASSHWRSFALIAATVVVLDQISKRTIDARLTLYDSWPNESWPFRLQHVKNTGAAFSLLQNQAAFLTVMSLVGLAAILFYFVFRPSDHPLLRLALALQLGGAIGNLIDRARYGHVTDFIRIPHWPVFNIADSAISVGVTAVVILLLFTNEGEGGRRAERAESS